MVDQTLPEIVLQCCSKCKEIKHPDRIVKNRKICKDCCNKKNRETFYKKVVDATKQKTCSKCNTIKNEDLFTSIHCNVCKDCNNDARRKHYQENEDFRLKKREEGIEYKKKRKATRDEIKQNEIKTLEERIGEDNTICKYCKDVKAKTHFRYNRLKCKDCEREEPTEKLKRVIRSRIHIALKGKKSKHTHEYLGCKPVDYLKWLLIDPQFTLENRGKVWHIDHIIPLSKFDLNNQEELALAFNWRNTMPLLAKDNLAKNSKIIPSQIEQHLKTLTTYHIENSIELPQIYIDLFAKHLAAGNP